MRKSIVILAIALGLLAVDLALLGQMILSARFSFLNQTVPTPSNPYDPAYYGLPPTIGGYKVLAVLTPDDTPCMPSGTKRLVLQAIQPNVEEFLRTNNSADIKTDLEQRGMGEYYRWGVQIVGPGIVREEFLAEHQKSAEFSRKYGCVTTGPNPTLAPAPGLSLTPSFSVQSTVAPTVLPPGPSATPIICTQNPPGLVLGITVKTESQPPSQRVFIDAKGFIPDEKLLIAVEGHGKNHGSREERFGVPVSADGTLTTAVSLQTDEPNMNWKLYGVHKRGVACASFTTQ